LSLIFLFLFAQKRKKRRNNIKMSDTTQQNQEALPKFYLRQFRDGEVMVHSVARFAFEALGAVKHWLKSLKFEEWICPDGKMRFHQNGKHRFMITRKDGETMWNITTVPGTAYCITAKMLIDIVQVMHDEGLEMHTPKEDGECVTPWMGEMDRLYVCSTAADRMLVSPTTVLEADEDEKKWHERREKGQRVEAVLDNLHKRLKLATGSSPRRPVPPPTPELQLEMHSE
jgi:hypothetical protein